MTSKKFTRDERIVMYAWTVAAEMLRKQGLDLAAAKVVSTAAAVAQGDKNARALVANLVRTATQDQPSGST